MPVRMARFMMADVVEIFRRAVGRPTEPHGADL
jgi:hypothetical protein